MNTGRRHFIAKRNKWAYDMPLKNAKMILVQGGSLWPGQSELTEFHVRITPNRQGLQPESMASAILANDQ